MSSVTKSELLTRSNVIRVATIPDSLPPAYVGALFRDLTDSALKVYPVSDTASTSEIQDAAATANAAGGGVVQLGVGTYTLTTVGSNVALALSGYSNIHLRGMGVVRTILTQANGADSHLVNIDGGSNLAISHMTLDGNRANQTAGVHGIRTDTGGVLGLDLRHLEVRDCFGYGIGLQGGTKKRVTVENVWIYDVGSDGLDIKNTDDDNESISIHRLLVERWGLNGALTEQAALDCRGPCEVSHFWAADGPADGRYFRFREGPLLDSSGYGAHRSHLTHFHLVGNGGATSVGVYVPADDCTMDNGYVSDMLIGVLVHGVRASIDSVHVFDVADEAFQVNAAADLTAVSNCHANTAVGSGFRVRGTRTTMTGCSSIAATVSGVVTESTATFFECSGFKCTGTGSSVGMDIDSADAVITAGSVTANNRGVRLNGARSRAIGTVSYANTDGFLIDTSADDSALIGVTARDNTDDGVQVRADRGFIGGGSVITGNTQNGVEIESSADNTRIAETRFSGNGAPLSDAGTNTRLGAAAIENIGLGGEVATSISEDVASAGTSANIDIPIVSSRTYLFRVKVVAEDAAGDRGTKIVLIDTGRSGAGAPSTPTQVSMFTSGAAADITINNTISSNNLRLSVTNGMGADAHLTIRVTEVYRDATVEDS